MAAGRAGTSASSHNGLPAARSMAVAIARLLFMSLSTVYASPLPLHILVEHDCDEEPEVDGASKLLLLVVSMILVLAGGAFAGLTIALMGQDGIYLQVLARDYNDPQQGNAKRVYKLLKRGKHWVLVTLLLSNVIVNETLPVVLDRCLGGGVAAVVGSTVLIVIFGEILPQSVCVRYGLQIGGAMAKPVLFLMYATAPLSWPTAKLLDKLLGEDHGTVYKKSGLKTLVTLHKTLGDVSERLNQDEVTIISAVLDLKEKPVEKVMTPMQDVFVMSEDKILDEETMDIILSQGYSRIPIHEAGHPTNFVGMLLVKILITYDPEDCKKVRDFSLATLPETRPETSCLDIVNFFQEGKSHMVLVSEYPGEDHGALGVVTLEDVIEELIGEEIIDESDVYIDVHKAVRRLAPAPKARVQRHLSDDHMGKFSEDNTVIGDIEEIVESHNGLASRPTRSESSNGRNDLTSVLSKSPKTTTFMMRRSSTGVGGEAGKTAVAVRHNIDEVRQHLKHLGPSNPATNPKNTKSTTIKVKPGSRVPAVAGEGLWEGPHQSQDETTSLLRTNQISGSDGAQAVRESYGSVNPEASTPKPSEEISAFPDVSRSPTQFVDEAARTSAKGSQVYMATNNSSEESLLKGSRSLRKKTYVRHGSITENVIESKGVRKVVLETSSNDEDESGVVRASSPDEQRLQNRGNLTLLGRPTSDEESGDDDATGTSEDAHLLGESSIHKAGQGRETSNQAGSSGAGKKKHKKKRKGRP